MDPGADAWLNRTSKAMLFVAGLSGVAIILYAVIKAYRHRRQIQHALLEAKEAA
jgi:hypothetical protein